MNYYFCTQKQNQKKRRPTQLLAVVNEGQTHFKLSIADGRFSFGYHRLEGGGCFGPTFSLDLKAKTEDTPDRPVGFILQKRVNDLQP